MSVKILPIIVNPNPILRQATDKVAKAEIKTPEFQELCQAMALTMQKEDGAGLAAPQVGRSQRLIAVAIKDGALIMVNPYITKASLTKEWGEEGCLSVPGVFGQVKRHKRVKCKFLDMSGQERLIEAEGMLARVIQHEIDHLDGVLFIDKAKDLSQ